MLKITETQNRDVWEKFISENAFTTFMQSWDFGNFENNTGHKAKRYLITVNNILQAVCQVIVIKAKKGSFLYIPHGPIFEKNLIPVESYQNENFEFSENQKIILKNIFSEIYSFLKKIAAQEKCSFIRFNTSLPNNPKLLKCINSSNMHFAPIYLTSENACVIDLRGKNTDTLLQNMRKTTRYSIKKSMKEAVSISQKPKEEFFEIFLKLYEETTSREGFTGFSESYLREEFEAFEKENNTITFIASQNSHNLAAGLFIKTNNALFYHQGASNHPKVPAPYLLQWHAILFALESGCQFYNFWGTYIPHRTPKSWTGLSLFKEGFGTQTWSYIPTYDIVIDYPRYIITNLIERYIRLKRQV
ncbi:MAG: peptidoglycan bridge formation glycyltransferase FemA/FemB family protein [Patescibacteria group bacterium]